MDKIVSVSVVYSKDDGECFEVVERIEDANHCSIYLRRESGEVEPVDDVFGTDWPARYVAIHNAAKLSAEHGVPLERSTLLN